ncbi:MAG: cysteine--tRNA ligase, partial [Candidatus Omnitrophota bacterium]
MAIKIYNSLTRKKEEFVPLKKGKVGIYGCGPTVYDEPHIGHARSAYTFDVIKNFFEYRGYKVKLVRNVTDVDDKIIDKARGDLAKNPNAKSDLITAAKEIATKYLGRYYEDMDALGIRRADFEPKATEYIGKMVKMIERLIEKGFAYAQGGDVYFDVNKFNGYGSLSGQSADNMKLGARVHPGEKKRDPMDFALWKSAKPEEPAWESPWGMGRSGWHIECSTMSMDLLGENFDIHAGGLDLIFPHHENEIAQSECYSGKRFANYWIHNGLLTIDSEKMAKSLGNFISIKDILDRYHPEILKLFFLSGHYRSPVD